MENKQEDKEKEFWKGTLRLYVLRTAPEFQFEELK